MSENKKYFETACEGGVLKLSHEAALALIRTACSEIEGITEAQAPELADGDWMGSKGVWLTGGEASDACRIRIYINVALGQALAEMAAAVQEKVKSALESVSFLQVETVDVFVVGVRLGKE